MTPVWHIMLHPQQHPIIKRVVISLEQYMNLHNKWENRDYKLLHFSLGQERCQKVMGKKKTNPESNFSAFGLQNCVCGIMDACSVLPGL